MQKFNVMVEGTWCFDAVVEADSREEAIKSLMKGMDLSAAGSPTLFHTNQWIDGEGDNKEIVTKEIQIVDLKTGSIQKNHTAQGEE